MPLPSPYQLKKLLMYPRKLYMRRKENLEPGFIRSALELHYYRPAFYQWMAAVNANPSLLYQADLNADSVVLDAGAYRGDWALELLQRYNPKIHAFEPDPRNYKSLQKKSRDNPQLIPHEYGLGGSNETARMALELLGSSVYTETGNNSDVTWAEVEIRDIKDVWHALGLAHIDLMKINIEGAEFPLLERMQQADLLGAVDCFLIQFHEWHPGAYHRRRKIRHALAATHTLVWDYHFVWEKWQRK